MQISGIQKFSLLDFPEKTSCIVFTPGCNFRCGYCHNPEFVLPKLIQEIKESFIDEETFFSFLERRVGLLDGVVISGGEPTIHKGLYEFIYKIKSRGFLVKLDSNGGKPALLQQLIDEQLVDYIAMDVKTSMFQYQTLVGSGAKPSTIKQSIDVLIHSGVDYEFRTTLIKQIHSTEILQEMVDTLKGAKALYLQTFRSGTTLNPLFSQYEAFSQQEMLKIQELFVPVVDQVYIR